MGNFGIVYCGEHDADLLAEIRSRFGCLCIRRGRQAGFLIIGKPGNDSGNMRGFLKKLARAYGQDKVIAGTHGLDLTQIGEFYTPPRFFQRHERIYTLDEVSELLEMKAQSQR